MLSGTKPNIWGFSSAGRALAWHARGHRFDPGNLHQKEKASHRNVRCFLFYTPFVTAAPCHPFPTLSLTRHLSPAGESLSKGTAFRGGDKLFGTSIRRPLEGAGALAPEGVTIKFVLDICTKLWYNSFCNCVYSTSASISAFQAEEVGSIPITRSTRPEP